MLTWFRARASSIAAGLLLSLSVLTLPHVAESHHDPDLAILIVGAHDESAHRLGTKPLDGERPVHCLACHWSRSVRLPGHVKFPLQADGEATAVVPGEIFTAARKALVAQPPLRSPPPSPVLG